MNNFGRVQSFDEIADENAIRNLAHAFSDAVNRRDFDLFASIWSPDGEWTITDPIPSTAIGRDNIDKHVRELLEVWTFFVQQTHSGIVSVEGDVARASWTVQETGRTADGTRFYNNFAIYEDDLIKVDGVWSFTKRVYHYLWVDLSTPIPGNSTPPPTFKIP